MGWQMEIWRGRSLGRHHHQRHARSRSHMLEVLFLLEHICLQAAISDMLQAQTQCRHSQHRRCAMKWLMILRNLRLLRLCLRSRTLLILRRRVGIKASRSPVFVDVCKLLIFVRFDFGFALEAIANPCSYACEIISLNVRLTSHECGDTHS